MATLITGTKSGLGKYLSENIDNVDTLNRDDDYEKISTVRYNLIIHCANNNDNYTWGDTEGDFSRTNLYQFYKDNIFFTRDVANIKHDKFIHISTYDIEEDTPYSAAKRISETIVSTISRNYLIIRPSSLLGKSMKENTFTKILDGKPVYLTEDSIMNYISHEDVLKVIEAEYPYDGIVYLCSNENITLGEIADLFGKKIEFGDYKCQQKSTFTDYNTGKDSLDNVVKFITNYEDIK